MKRRWIVISVLTAMVALGVSGGAVLAQTTVPNGNSPVNTMISRVASILGLESSQLQEAFNQAAAEMRSEMIKSRLDVLEQKGRITAGQRDDLEDWINSMPEAVNHGFAVPGIKLHRFNGRSEFAEPSMHGQWPRSRGFPMPITP